MTNWNFKVRNFSQETQTADSLRKIFAETSGNLFNKYGFIENIYILKYLNQKIDNFASRGKPKKDFPINIYLRNLNYYFSYILRIKAEHRLKYYGLNSIQWNTIIKQIVEDSLEERENKIRNYLIEGREFLLVQGHCTSFGEYTMKTTAMGIIRGFYKSFGGYITIQTSGNARPMNENRLRITKNILENILKFVGNPIYQLILKIEAMMGLRFSDIVENLPHYRILKFKEHYYIKNFKTKKDGIIINFLFFPKEIEEDICLYYNCMDLRDAVLGLVFTTKGLRSIRNSDFNKAIKIICSEKLKLEGNFSSHQLRKYFRRRLGKSSMSYEFKEHMLGHSLKNETWNPFDL